MNASERSPKTQTDGLCILETHRVIVFFFVELLKNNSTLSSLKINLLIREMLQKLLISLDVSKTLNSLL